MSQPRSDHPFRADRVNGVLDYASACDVPSVGRAATDALLRDIDAARDRPAPDPARKLHLFRGNPGYGKTHLFGRVRHGQADRVQFVFVDAPPDKTRPTEYAAWRVVETLFHSEASGFAAVRVRLAALLAPSVVAYLDQLPAGLRARTREDRQAVERDSLAVLQMLSAVEELAPYHALADSLRPQLPGVPGGVVRALVLGLSRAAEDARAWLRGEAEQLTDGRAAELRLEARSPCPADVVRGAAGLCQLAGAPLVLCFDQLEVLFQTSPAAFADLAGQLMGWLQTVPNLVVVLGCVDETWKKVAGAAGYASFIDRVVSHELGPLDPDEAAELVIRRTRCWAEHDPARPPGWPFDPADVRRFAADRPASPRGFLQVCRAAFDAWEAGGRGGPALLGGAVVRPSREELFAREWEAQLDTTRAALKAAHDYQEAELWEGVAEALRVAQLGGATPPGVRVEGFEPRALKPTPSDPRPSGEVRLTAGGGRAAVVVAVTKKDGGVAFGHWLSALEGALGGTVAGAVVVRPRAQLAVGKTAAAYKRHQQLMNTGSVRVFPLDEHADAFAQLECLRAMVREAEAGALTVDGAAVTAADCRRLVAQTGVLARLKLFEHLFQNWASLTRATEERTTATPAGSVVTPPTPPPPRSDMAPTRTQTATVAPPVPAADPGPAPPAGDGWARQALETVVAKLRAKGQPVRPVGVEVGPTFARLKVEPRDDADFGRVKKQADNLKLHLGLEHRPLIAAQAGYISVDVQRPDRQAVPVASLLRARPPALAGRPAFPAGTDVGGQAHWLDLSDPGSCHLLVAGTTGSGKSEFLKALLAGLVDHLGPDQLQFALVDPKQVTFNLSGQSPYLWRPVAHDVEAALPVLEDCLAEMTRRYTRLRERGLEHVGQLTGADAVPRRVLVFDEFADLMSDRQGKRELETLLKRLGAMGRAAGIHLVLGTQRPEASVVTPLLRDNLPVRVGLQMAGERGSKLILEEPDAAHLLGRGDLLLRRGGGLLRLQSPLVARPELEALLRCH